MTAAAPTSRAELEKAIFDFLLTVRSGEPRARQPLRTNPDTLAAVVSQPHPDLVRALHHCLDVLAVEIVPDPATWGPIQAPAETLLVALAAHNCLAIGAHEDLDDPGVRAAAAFTTALVNALPAARQLPEALAYHAVLRDVEQVLPTMAAAAARAWFSLVERSPLTTLWLLDGHTPAALQELATELLVGWRRAEAPVTSLWASTRTWTGVVASLLSEPAVARWVHHRWLSMPETRAACRNQGLVLESLRRHGGQRDFILSFYEAYEQFTWRAYPGSHGLGSSPGLDMAARLLTTPGHSEAAMRANGWGNEYFLKFHAYIEIIQEENGVPRADYRLLTLEFVQQALEPLADYVTRPQDQAGVTFGEIAFAGQGQE